MPNTEQALRLAAIILLTGLSGCSDDQQSNSTETDKPHMLQPQQDILNQAKAIEGTVEQAYQRQQEALQENR